ncbi:MAG: LysM peptidoglycan-binding domain-containing protein, partial [Ardenticatenaceae bacterium]
MTLSNPSLNSAHVQRAASIHSQQLKTQFKRTRAAVEGLAAFVVDEHLSTATLRAFWRREERATLAVRTIGQTLDMDLAGLANAIYEQLEQSAALPLVEFQTSEAAYLFATIASIEPDELSVGDGRAAAERFQYAAEARVALLRYALSELIRRYTPTFADTSFAETHAWLQAFSDLLDEAREVIADTRQLLWDEGTAIQSYLDSLRSRFELLDAQASAAAIVVREDWPALLQGTEKRLLDHLAHRQEQIEMLVMGEVDESRGGLLETLARQTGRRAPLLGALLLALAGAGALSASAERSGMPDIALLPNLREGFDRLTGSARAFPILARSDEHAASNLPRQSDEIAHFFAMQPRPRGRQTLVIRDSATLQRVLDELSRFGYARRDVLRLFGMNSVSQLAGPLTMDVRWGQGERLLLLPPHQAVAGPASAVAAEAHEVRLGATLVASRGVAAPVRFDGAVKPITSLIVHHVADGDTLSSLAERYDTTVSELMSDNRLESENLAAGKMLLVRAAGRVVAVTLAGESESSPGRGIGTMQVTSGGSILVPSSRVPTAIAPVAFTPAKVETLVARYGDTIFPSIEAMPEDARRYFSGTVQEIADFFNVRPGDIVGILQAENNNAGLRLHQPAVSSAGARGVGQVIARTWNGWANPHTESHLHDLRSIEQHGGLGFDWAMREAWRDWKEGKNDGAILAYANADPDRFENSVAAVARHLVHWGLTRDRAASEPEWFETQLADAISVYNSGRPLAEARDFVQSAANRKTTGQYVEDVLAVSAIT